jgi:uncharacterized membrane protein
MGAEMIDEQRVKDLETRLSRVEDAVGLALPPRPEPPRPRTLDLPAAPRAELRSSERFPRPADVERAETARPEAPGRAIASAPAATPPWAPRHADGGRAAPQPSLEDLLGGRVLAWVGGAALLVGVAFFLAIAVSRGWLGEEARCLLAAAGALALLGFGVRTQQRGGAPAPALTAIGVGIAALDLDVAVAAQAYNLVAPGAGIALVLGVGAAATALAVRRSSRTIAAFGILGGLLAPAFAGAAYDGATIALLLAATGPAAAILIAKRWDAIAIGAFAVTAPQLGLWLLDGPGTLPTLLALSAFGALFAAQAVGFELRTASRALRPASAFLLVLDALVLAGAGAAVLLGHHDATAAHLWLFGLAAAHLAVGMAADRLPRVSRELGLLALSLGVVLADVALAATLSGVVLPVAYAAGALAFVGLSRTLPARQADHLFVRAGLGGHVLLAAAHALIVDAPATAFGPGASLNAAGAALALGAVAAASFAAARAAVLPHQARAALDVTALAAIAWLGALTLDPVALAVAWTVEAAALAQVWRRGPDAVAAGAAWAHLVAAATVTLVLVAPPTALADGLDDPLGALLTLGALMVALGRAGQLRLPVPGVELPAGCALAAAATVALYLASTLVVTPLAPHVGQTALSALWAAAGVATLVTGLAATRRPLRRAGLGLLVMTIGKVFLVDLATLDSAARAGSFLALGVLLLGAAAAWHRFAPRTAAEPA